MYYKLCAQILWHSFSQNKHSSTFDNHREKKNAFEIFSACNIFIWKRQRIVFQTNDLELRSSRTKIKRMMVWNVHVCVYGPIHSSHQALKPGDQFQSQPACFKACQRPAFELDLSLLVLQNCCPAAVSMLCVHFSQLCCLGMDFHNHILQLSSLDCGESMWWREWLMQLLLKMSNSAFTILVPLIIIWGDEEAWIQVEFAFFRPQFSYKTGCSALQSCPLTLYM